MKFNSKGAVLCICAAIAFGAQAQTTKSTNRTRPAQASTPATVAAPTPTPALSPTGPTGIGSLKVGMTREAVQGIPTDEPVRLQGELAPAESKTPPPPGTGRFKGKLAIGNSVIDTTLTFKDGVLTYFSLSSESDVLIDSLARQIADKYGPGKAKDDRKEEQCIYRNGNSFTLKSGMVSTDWTTPVENGTVSTSVMKMEINFCPSNLRYGTTGGIKMNSLSFGLSDKADAAAPKKSLF